MLKRLGVSVSVVSYSLLPPAREVFLAGFFVAPAVPRYNNSGSARGGGVMVSGWVIGAAALAGVLGLLLLWGFLSTRAPSVEVARRQFQQQREHLEAKFFELAASSGKPRGLRWKECDWSESIEFGRDRRSGQLVALAGVTITFEAIEGSDMEGLSAVGNLRSASALFSYGAGRWVATGRTVFNLRPDEALRHFQQQYERVPP